MMTLEAMLCRRARRQGWLNHLAMLDAHDQGFVDDQPKRPPGRPPVQLDDGEINRATRILDGGGSYSQAAQAIGRSRYAVMKALPGWSQSKYRSNR